MTTLLKSHWILITGAVWFLLVLAAHIVIKRANLQYDDGGLGTILILGKPVYAFPFWFFSEVDVLINRIIPPPFVGLLLFLIADVIACRVRRKKARSNTNDPG